MKHILFTDCSLMARLLAGLAIVGACAGCPADSSAPEALPDRSCEMSLRLLGKAIAKYRAANGPLPQSVTGPMGFEHSWRILVAPYRMGDKLRHMDYRLDEPWNSAHNRQQILNWFAGEYTCPLELPSLPYPYVSYVMLVRADVTDSDGNTRDQTPLPDDAVLIVESVKCGIENGEPRDIVMESLFEGDSPFGVGKLNSLHPGVVKALRVDGKVIDIPKKISNANLRKLLAGTTANQRGGVPVQRPRGRQAVNSE